MKNYKALTVLALTASLALGSLASATPVNAATLTADNSFRIAGPDRYQTSLKVSFEGWEDNGAPTVVVATGADFPDALAATPLASSFAAPLLLSKKDSLPAGFLEELKRLGTTKVILVGGTGAVSQKVEDQLKSLKIGTKAMAVERISGKSRYETAVNIAKRVGVKDTLYVTTGSNFADALSVSPIAGLYEDPILLVPSTGVPQIVSDYIKANQTNVVPVIMGGEKLVSPAVEELFSEEAIRFAGATRYDTNKQFNDMVVSKEWIPDASTLFIATGTNFPDALSGSALASLVASPILLTAANPTLPSKQQIKNYETPNSHYVLLGGEGALSKDTLNKLFAE